MRIRKQQQHPVAVVGSRAVGGGVMERTAAAAGIIVMEQQQEDPSPVEPPPSTATPLLSDHDDIFVRRGGGEPLLASSAPLESSSPAEAHPHHLEVLSNGGDDDGDGSSRSSFRRLLYLLTSPLTDDQGRQPLAIVMGLLSMALGGIILGMLLPKSDSLPSQVLWLPAFISYRTVSSCIGYTYFLSWSTSFYPQLVANFRRKTTAGLSADFCVLNVLGFSCYTAYNVALYASPMVRRLYHERHHNHQQYDEQDSNNSIPVQSNDVAFAVHALLVSSMTLLQIGYYNGFHSQRPSKVIGAIIAVMLTIIISLPIYIVIHGGGNKEINHFENDVHYHVNWLDYLYVLSSIKVCITLIKYLPQVVLNCKRQSTTGWSIWQILLDMTGGVLSDLQLVLDCAALQDWTGITGNLAKLVLGSASIVFDLIFFLQHYILYKSSSSLATGTSTPSASATTTTPLLSNSNSSCKQPQAASGDNDGTTAGGKNKKENVEAPIHSFV